MNHPSEFSVIEQIKMLLEEKYKNPFKLYNRFSNLRVNYPVIYNTIMRRGDLREIYDVIEGRKTLEEVTIQNVTEQQRKTVDKDKILIEEIKMLDEEMETKNKVGTLPWTLSHKYSNIKENYPFIYERLVYRKNLRVIYDIIDGKKTLEEVTISDCNGNEKKN